MGVIWWFKGGFCWAWGSGFVGFGCVVWASWLAPGLPGCFNFLWGWYDIVSRYFWIATFWRLVWGCDSGFWVVISGSVLLAV